MIKQSAESRDFLDRIKKQAQENHSKFNKDPRASLVITSTRNIDIDENNYSSGRFRQTKRSIDLFNKDVRLPSLSSVTHESKVQSQR